MDLCIVFLKKICTFYINFFFVLFQNIEKDQQISSLQRQLDSQTLDSSSTSNTRENSFEFPAKSKINGATQTERV